MRGWLLLVGVWLSGCSGAVLGRSYSLDHQHRAELRATWRGMVVQRDGVMVARYPLVDLDTLRLSAQGGHLAFAARTRLGWQVVVDGRPSGPQWDAVLPGSLRLGDGGQLSLVARRAAALFVVHAAPAQPEITEGPYDGVTELQVDEPAAHRAYIARRGALAFIVLDGRELGPHEAVAELKLSPRGGRWAAIVRRAGRWWVLHEGTAVAHDSAAGLRFCPRGEHLYYVARDGGRERVVHAAGGREGPSFTQVEWRTLQAASGDETTGPLYVAQRAEQRFLVHRGELGPPYDSIRSPRLSERRSAYLGRRGDQEQAVIDGQPGPWYDEVADPVIAEAADSGYAYLGRRGTQVFLVLPGRELPLRWALAGSLTLCPDGSHVGLLGGVKAQALQLLIDGQPAGTFEAEEPEEVRRVWGSRGLSRWVAAALPCAAAAPQ
jgi:hypothetical protein